MADKPTIHVDIVSAEGEIFSGEAAMFFAPGADGDLGIAPRHAPLLTLLKPGEVRVQTPDGQEQQISATLKQEGEKLTGEVESPLGKVEIKDGKVKDGELSFYITFERDGNEIKANFSGKLAGDNIKGKVEVGAGDMKRTMDWEPKRSK